MLRTLLAALASLAVLAAQPALACDDCKDCPMHKKAAAAKADGKGAQDAKAGCPCCVAAGKECKHGPDAPCPHCDAKKAAEKKATETKG